VPRAAWLLAGYLTLWLALAAGPADRGAWLLENALPLSLVVALAGTWRHWPLSDAAYAGVAAFLALHAVGAHYGYPHVPAGWWLRDAFHALGWATARNPYDRVVHFAFGLLLLQPLEELLRRVVWRPRAAAVLAVALLLAAGGVYEVLEWGAARLLAPDTASTFVGAQGDPWDAQQDLALAGAGSLAALVVRALARRDLGRRAPRAASAGEATGGGATPGAPVASYPRRPVARRGHA
jgi:putative membrane protein